MGRAGAAARSRTAAGDRWSALEVEALKKLIDLEALANLDAERGRLVEAAEAFERLNGLFERLPDSLVRHRKTQRGSARRLVVLFSFFGRLFVGRLLTPRLLTL